MKTKRNIEPVNLTPMIDIVFQMIIFFVFTLDLEREKFDKDLLIPDAPDAEEITKFEPATIYPQVLANGTVKVGTAVTTPTQFRGLVRQAVKLYGNDIPVMIYAEGAAEHRHIKNVMDICSSENLYKIHIIGMLERAD
jgi:biopolymer transport protein ExbD